MGNFMGFVKYKDLVVGMQTGTRDGKIRGEVWKIRKPGKINASIVFIDEGMRLETIHMPLEASIFVVSMPHWDALQIDNFKRKLNGELIGE